MAPRKASHKAAAAHARGAAKQGRQWKLASKMLLLACLAVLLVASSAQFLRGTLLPTKNTQLEQMTKDASVKHEVHHIDCSEDDPGVQCVQNPCLVPEVQASACATAGDIMQCVPFTCTKPASLRGAEINVPPCTPVFVQSFYVKPILDCSQGFEGIGNTAATSGTKQYVPMSGKTEGTPKGTLEAAMTDQQIEDELKDTLAAIDAGKA